MWILVAGFLMGICGFLLIVYIRILKGQKDRAVADYIKVSDMLINGACQHIDQDGACRHQRILQEHRIKGCIAIHGS